MNRIACPLVEEGLSAAPSCLCFGHFLVLNSQDLQLSWKLWPAEQQLVTLPVRTESMNPWTQPFVEFTCPYELAEPNKGLLSLVLNAQAVGGESHNQRQRVSMACKRTLARALSCVPHCVVMSEPAGRYLLILYFVMSRKVQAILFRQARLSIIFDCSVLLGAIGLRHGRNRKKLNWFRCTA